jgi:DNA protecting protein DprA
MRVRCCDACLRRTWLVARLAGWIELARHEGRRLPEVLALDDESLLRAVAPSEVARTLAAKEALDLEAERQAYVRAGLNAVCRHEPAYPAALRDDRAGPPILSWAGALPDGPAVAVVGTRRASPDGLEVARGLGRGLAAARVTVVSGMALGIDSAAHEGALQAGGPTVAVLAGGADVAYPRSKRALHGRIREQGAVVSEAPPGFVPRRWCFPARNRIIAALASATIVVQAAARSGSLIPPSWRWTWAVTSARCPVRRWTGAARASTACCATAPAWSGTPRTRSTSPSASVTVSERIRRPAPPAWLRCCARCCGAWGRAPRRSTRLPQRPRRPRRRWRA